MNLMSYTVKKLPVDSAYSNNARAMIGVRVLWEPISQWIILVLVIVGRDYTTT